MSNAPALTTRPLFARGRVVLTRPPSYRRADAFTIRINDGTLGHTRTLSVGDVVHARAFNGTATADNHWQVVSYDDPGASAGYFQYDVVRVDGSAASFPAGTPLALAASAGVGQNFISLSADGQIGASPNITIGRYNSSPWLSPTVLARLGNLNGSYGVVTDSVGVGVGDYSGGNYIRYYEGGSFTVVAGGGSVSLDPNGLSFVSGSSTAQKLKFYDGAALLGSLYMVSSDRAYFTFLAKGGGAGQPNAQVWLKAAHYTTATYDASLTITSSTTESSVAAVANSLTLQDGDLYFLNDGSGLAYAHVWGNEIAWSQASASQNVWYLITDVDMTDGELNAVTHDGSGKLTVTRAGRYLVNYAVTLSCSALNKHIQTGIAINGTVGNLGIQHYDISSPSAEITLASTAIVDVAASTTIEVAVRTTDTGTPTIDVDHLNITVLGIGGT